MTQRPNRALLSIDEESNEREMFSLPAREVVCLEGVPAAFERLSPFLSLSLSLSSPQSRADGDRTLLLDLQKIQHSVSFSTLLKFNECITLGSAASVVGGDPKVVGPRAPLGDDVEDPAPAPRCPGSHVGKSFRFTAPRPIGCGQEGCRILIHKLPSASLPGRIFVVEEVQAEVEAALVQWLRPAFLRHGLLRAKHGALLQGLHVHDVIDLQDGSHA